MFALQPEPEAGHRGKVLFAASVFSSLSIFGVLLAASHLPQPQRMQKTRTPIVMRIIKRQPPVEMPQPELRKPPAAVAKPPLRSKSQPQVKARVKPAPVEVVESKFAPQPMPVDSPQPAAVAAPLIVGLTLSSTSRAGKGPRVAVGNTLMGTPQGIAQASKAGPLVKRVAQMQAKVKPAKSKRTDATLLVGKPPFYPAAAKRHGVEGVVVLTITIGTNGRVSSARVLRGLSLALDAAALAAARKTIWAPAMLGGQPTLCTRRFNVRFSLQG